MATAEELLNSISKNQVSVLSEDDGIFVIDGESRTITVPDSERLFGVEGDKDVERKYFQCPKIVGDNIDLSQHQIYVSYVFTTTENNTIFPTIGNGLYHCEDVEVSGDNITFSWLLSGNVFANPGFIAFKVMAKKSEGSELKTKWNTAPAIGTVLLTVPDGEEIAEEYPDVINQILDRLDAIEESGGSGYALPAMTETKLGGGKAVEKTTESIPVAVDENGQLWVPEQSSVSIDATLTKQGEAADSKIVGDKINDLQYKKFSPKLYCSIDCININSDDCKKQIDRAMKMLCSGIYVCVHLNDDCKSYQNQDVVGFAFDYCDKNNLDSILKVHYDGDDLNENSVVQDDYKKIVIQLIGQYNTNSIFIFNEETSVYSNQLNKNFIIDMITSIKQSGLKCGISFSGNTDFLNVYRNININEIITYLDIIGINTYPEISYNGQYTTILQSKDSWNRYLYLHLMIKKIYPEKEICITETGILDAWENLAFPWHWDNSSLDTITSSNGEAQKIFFNGMFLSDKIQKIDSVCLWFIESYTNEEFIKFFKNNVR